MNRSFSKIRHIQEANKRIEKRFLTENKTKEEKKPEEPKQTQTLQSKVNAIVDKLSDSEKEELKTTLDKLGIEPDSSLKQVVQIVNDSTPQEKGEMDEEEKSTKEKVADTLAGLGSALAASHLVPIIPVAIGQAADIGFGGGLAVSLGTSLILLSLAKALGHKSKD